MPRTRSPRGRGAGRGGASTTLGGASSDPPESQDTATCRLDSIRRRSSCCSFSSARTVLERQHMVSGAPLGQRHTPDPQTLEGDRMTLHKRTGEELGPGSRLGSSPGTGQRTAVRPAEVPGHQRCARAGLCPRVLGVERSHPGRPARHRRVPGQTPHGCVGQLSPLANHLPKSRLPAFIPPSALSAQDIWKRAAVPTLSLEALAASSGSSWAAALHLPPLDYSGAAAPHTPPCQLGGVPGLAVSHPETTPKAAQLASAHSHGARTPDSAAAGPGHSVPLGQPAPSHTPAV